MKWTSWVALGGLAALGSFIVWSSLQVAGVRCEVCVDFGAASACRAVDAASEQEALAAARNNACAQLTSGVTNMMACERTDPKSSTCRSP